ncbi:hypothetical protein AGOR_G00040010 [Albula goreensis]|uniref:Cathelicidin n=1 Tax=Albula goreensis TaxID=1534307 RepID=A0A8T3DZX1_9TELE|nr:hypothetical protein AGOR_G00040010 [Albula goreensis]
MKTLVKTLLVALAGLLVTAQRGVKFSYESAIVDAITRYTQQTGEEYTFRPLLRALQVETLYPESEDKPVVVRRLRFPLQETICQSTEDQMGKQCPIKKDGKSLLCDMTFSQLVNDGSIPLTTEMRCEPMIPDDQQQHKIRMRRSKSSRGSRGRGSSGGRRGGRTGRVLPPVGEEEGEQEGVLPSLAITETKATLEQLRTEEKAWPTKPSS